MYTVTLIHVHVSYASTLWNVLQTLILTNWRTGYGLQLHENQVP